MIADNPTHLNCPYCPAQAFLLQARWSMTFAEYGCPAHHRFYIEVEDTSFNFGHNKED
jgi:hypothetical protein